MLKITDLKVFTPFESDFATKLYRLAGVSTPEELHGKPIRLIFQKNSHPKKRFGVTATIKHTCHYQTISDGGSEIFILGISVERGELPIPNEIWFTRIFSDPVTEFCSCHNDTNAEYSLVTPQVSVGANMRVLSFHGGAIAELT